MILYVNGCSHSAGHCLPKDQTYSFMLASSLFGKDNFEFIEIIERSSYPDNYSNYKNVFSKLDKNKHYLIFQTDFGKSNDRIFFESINFLYESISNKLNIDYCVIQWSGPNRSIHIQPEKNNNCTIYDVNPHDNKNLGLKFEPFASIQTIQFMTILQELYEKYKINYSYIPYMELDKKVTYSFHLYKNLKLDKFTTDPSIGYRNYFRKRGWVCDEQGHPSIYANYYMTNEVLNTLKCDNLIGLFDFFSSKKTKLNLNKLNNLKNKIKESSFIKKHFDSLGDATKSMLGNFGTQKTI